MVEPVFLDAAPVFPPGEITAPGLRVFPLEGLMFAAVAARHSRTAELAAKVQAVFGAALPDGPSQTESGEVSFIGVGPDAWLAVCSDLSLVTRLAETAQGLAAVADQSGAYGLLAVEGGAARALLARAVALDLDPAVFGEGAAAVCAFGHLGVVLWRAPGSDSFRLALQRSTAADAWRQLAHAAASLSACG